MEMITQNVHYLEVKMDVAEILQGSSSEPPASTGAEKAPKDQPTPGALKEPSKLPKVERQKSSRLSREVYALLYSDNKGGALTNPLAPTDTGSGYRQPRARLGRKHVRQWKRVDFTNSAREDELVLNHWARAADEGKPYPFSKFNKTVDTPTYTEEEYTSHLSEVGWSKEETDHLLELCKRFDNRFVIVHDRFDTSKFSKRSVEDLKERYYSISNRLTRVRTPGCDESQLIAYDAPHETKRKMQLEKLLSRSSEQVAEEERLIEEMKKIELRKKERERKQQDLQKLISAAEQNSDGTRKSATKKAPPSATKKIRSAGTPGQTKVEGSSVFKSYDKNSGVSLRSSKLKTPMSLGQKKSKAIEQLLEELGVPLRPSPTEQICVQFNDLRNDILLLLELKAACDVCEFDLQSLKHRYEGLSPDRQARITLPDMVPMTTKRPLSSSLHAIDVVNSAASSGRKRRLAALDSVIKKQRKS